MRDREWVLKNVFTTTLASEYLGITRQGLIFAVNAGKLKQLRRGMFLKSDLDEYRKLYAVKKG